MSSRFPCLVSPSGVSLVICSFNGARRLPAVFASLEAQTTIAGLRWEILLIDNASTDGTGRLAESQASGHPDVPLRVLFEPTPGLMHARTLALSQARYEYVSFIDDDNILPPEWIQQVRESMDAHPDAGALGGSSVAQLAGPPPVWFSKYAKQYAVGEQAASGDATQKPGYLWGSGLTLRRSAWLQLRKAGFRSRLTGRRGRTLLAGEDTELCLALRLAGWRLRYESTLQLTHAIDQERLTWQHLRRMHRGFGASTTAFDAYNARLTDIPGSARNWHRQAWRILRRLARDPSMACEALVGRENRPRALDFDKSVGRLRALLRLRHHYDASFDQVVRLEAALQAMAVPAAASLTQQTRDLPERITGSAGRSRPT